jgi:hypothetical protein
MLAGKLPQTPVLGTNAPELVQFPIFLFFRAPLVKAKLLSSVLT